MVTEEIINPIPSVQSPMDIRDKKIEEMRKEVAAGIVSIKQQVATILAQTINNNVDKGITAELATGFFHTQVNSIHKYLDKFEQVLCDRLVEYIPLDSTPVNPPEGESQDV